MCVDMCKEWRLQIVQPKNISTNKGNQLAQPNFQFEKTSERISPKKETRRKETTQNGEAQSPT